MCECEFRYMIGENAYCTHKTDLIFYSKMKYNDGIIPMNDECENCIEG